MKTNDEVRELQRNWLNDPTWDIEDTEGFEEYHDYLLAFHQDRQACWREDHRREVMQNATEWGCSPQIAEQFSMLLARVAHLEHTLALMDYP